MVRRLGHANLASGSACCPRTLSVLKGSASVVVGDSILAPILIDDELAGMPSAAEVPHGSEEEVAGDSRRDAANQEVAGNPWLRV